jgi:hypothetical protein
MHMIFNNQIKDDDCEKVKLWPLDHYCPLEGKTEGIRSTPYYSIEINYPH